MIVVHLIGGMGNQMFQYAFGRSLALKNSTELKLDLTAFATYKLHKYSLDKLNIQAQPAQPGEVGNLIFGVSHPIPLMGLKILQKVLQKLNLTPFFLRRSFLEEKEYCFSPEFLSHRGEAYIKGYWQTEKYFRDFREQLLTDFEIKIPPSEKNRRMLDQINDCSSVSVHVRRADYLTDPTASGVYVCCDMDYYRQAINQIRERVSNPKFFVFSDDCEWAEQQFGSEKDITVADINDASANYEDLRLMGNCRHNIIANSSFSWWGAWLNRNPEKVVVAPRNWFKGDQFDTKDIVPEGWIKI